jgi:hypothetical protein
MTRETVPSGTASAAAVTTAPWRRRGRRCRLAVTPASGRLGRRRSKRGRVAAGWTRACSTGPNADRDRRRLGAALRTRAGPPLSQERSRGTVRVEVPGHSRAVHSRRGLRPSGWILGGDRLDDPQGRPRPRQLRGFMKPSQPRLVISSSTSTTSITAVGCGPLPSPVTGETLARSRQRWSSTRAATCTRPIPASGRSSVSTPLEEKHALVRCLAGRIAHHQTRQRTASTTAASESSAATDSSRRLCGRHRRQG